MRQVLIKTKENATKMHNVKHAIVESSFFVPWVPDVVSGDGTGEAGSEHTTEQAHTHIGLHTRFYWHLSHITYTLRESLRKSPLLLPTTSIYTSMKTTCYWG